MESQRCPRCRGPVVYGGRGRRPRWCSADCRRRGHEQQIRVHEIVRERVVEREILTPRTPSDAVDLVLSDFDATEQLLNELAHRMRRNPPQSERERIHHRLLHPVLQDLWDAYNEAVGANAALLPKPRVPTPAPDPKTLQAGLSRGQRRKLSRRQRAALDRRS